jgi:hypothetical protein
MYCKEPRYIEWKIRHFLASLFADSLPFPKPSNDTNKTRVIFNLFGAVTLAASQTEWKDDAKIIK